MFPTSIFHLSRVQVLWDHLGGAELSEKDGGESEAIEASQKGCEHDYHGRSKRWTHRRQQDPTSTGTGCGIPGGTGRGRLTSAQTHADVCGDAYLNMWQTIPQAKTHTYTVGKFCWSYKLLLSSVTNFIVIWIWLFCLTLPCTMCVSDPEDGPSAKWHFHVLHSDGPCERGPRARWTEPVTIWLHSNWKTLTCCTHPCISWRRAKEKHLSSLWWTDHEECRTRPNTTEILFQPLVQ